MAKPPTIMTEQEKQIAPHQGEPKTMAEFFHKAVNTAKSTVQELSKKQLKPK